MRADTLQWSPEAPMAAATAGEAFEESTPVAAAPAGQTSVVTTPAPPVAAAAAGQTSAATTPAPPVAAVAAGETLAATTTAPPANPARIVCRAFRPLKKRKLTAPPVETARYNRADSVAEAVLLAAARDSSSAVPLVVLQPAQQPVLQAVPGPVPQLAPPVCEPVQHPASKVAQPLLQAMLPPAVPQSVLPAAPGAALQSVKPDPPLLQPPAHLLPNNQRVEQESDDEVPAEGAQAAVKDRTGGRKLSPRARYMRFWRSMQSPSSPAAVQDSYLKNKGKKGALTHLFEDWLQSKGRWENSALIMRLSRVHAERTRGRFKLFSRGDLLRKYDQDCPLCGLLTASSSN